MNIIILLIFNIAFVLLYFDLNLNHRVKGWIGLDRFKHKKPYDCHFCLLMWIGIIQTIVKIIQTEYKQAIIMLIASYVVAKIIDKLWNL